MKEQGISISRKKISEFCQSWEVIEFAIFGSAIRDDFSSQSDVDVLVTFASDVQIGLFDLVQMQIELEGIFGRPVDLVEKASLRNPYRRHEILKTAQVVYAF